MLILQLLHVNDGAYAIISYTHLVLICPEETIIETYSDK